MNCLLDVSSLVALLWRTHLHHQRVKAWSETMEVLAVCPISEVGFLRISSAAYGSSVSEAAEVLASWLADRESLFVPCHIRALNGIQANFGKHATDFYLCNLARAHGMLLATLDEGIVHPAAFLIPKAG